MNISMSLGCPSSPLHIPTQPATPTPSATTSAILDPSLAAGAAALPWVSEGLAAVPVLVMPDRLAVDPDGLISVVVEATGEVRVLSTLLDVAERGPPGCDVPLDDMVMVPVAVGVDVSVSGMVKPGDDERGTLVRGNEARGLAAWRCAVLASWRESARTRRGECIVVFVVTLVAGQLVIGGEELT